MEKRENKPKSLQIVEKMSLRPFLKDEAVEEAIQYYYNPKRFIDPNTFFKVIASIYLIGYASGKRAERKRRKKA